MNTTWRTGPERDMVELMRCRNGTRDEKLWVIVQGPEDDEVTLMPLADAVREELFYRWEAR